jgi:uncharacterized protein YcbK (DUF882 family)
MTNEQMTQNFRRREFACRCGCGFDTINLGLVMMLQALRDRLVKPIHVHCGCRCPAHNKRVGGVPESQHVGGLAADISVDGVDPSALFDMCRQFDGVGLYEWGVHVDVRGWRARWEDMA